MRYPMTPFSDYLYYVIMRNIPWHSDRVPPWYAGERRIVGGARVARGCLRNWPFWTPILYSFRSPYIVAVGTGWPITVAAPQAAALLPGRSAAT
jgi:hypothetical protein